MRFPPPEVMASWPKPNYVDPVRRGNESIIIQAVLVALVTIFVAIRLYARIAITKAGVGLDDVLIVISAVCLFATPGYLIQAQGWLGGMETNEQQIFGLGLTAGVILAIHNYGWDIHVWDLPPEDSITSRKVSWASMLLYLTSSSLTKTSILVFYLRILVAKKDKFVTKITLGAMIIYYVVLLIVLFAQCRPLPYYWEILIPGAEGKCLEEGIHMVTAGVLNLIFDLIIFTIPLRSLFLLKIRTTQKLQVISLFSAGLIVIAAASMRLYYNVVVFLQTYDVSWYGYVAWLWAAIEVHVSIICACVPSCRAFFASWTVRGSSKGRSGGGGTYPSKPGGRSFNNTDAEEDARLTNIKMGSMAKVEAGSMRSGISGDSEETREGIDGREAEIYRLYSTVLNNGSSFPFALTCSLDTPACKQCIKSNRECGGYQRERLWVPNNQVKLEGGVALGVATQKEAGTPPSKTTGKASKNNTVALVWTSAPNDPHNDKVVAPTPRLGRMVDSYRPFQQQLLGEFMHAFIPNYGTSASAEDSMWLVCVPEMVGSSPALEAVLMALSTAQLGRAHDSTDLVYESRRLYCVSLRELGKALKDMEKVYKDETLAACVALALYEVVECPAESDKGLVTHSDGCMRLIEARGPEAHTGDVGHMLFQSCRYSSLMHGLSQNRSNFMSEAKWLDAPFKGRTKSLSDKFMEVFIQGLSILEAAQAIGDLKTPSSLLACLAVIDSCWRADAAMRALYAELEASVDGPLFWPELSTLDNPADDAQTGKLFPVSYHFANFRVAKICELYWAICIILWGGLFHLYHALAIMEPLTPDEDDCECTTPVHVCPRGFSIADLPPLQDRDVMTAAGDWGRGSVFGVKWGAMFKEMGFWTTNDDMEQRGKQKARLMLDWDGGVEYKQLI
ncbi:hypothetical protein V494_03269 [Pseudogymnoascus sp. VKM F-4513 (FW-928)]|nr:hypothetical protein V494_03269 [Pseudogymnoascus sp. VKM F-4513 (FW-928)]